MSSDWLHFFARIAVKVVIGIVVSSVAFAFWKLGQRRRLAEVARLEKLPSIVADFTTPEGAETTAAWPDLEGVRSFFISCEPYAPGVVAVTEKLVPQYADIVEQVVLVSDTVDGFRVARVL